MSELICDRRIEARVKRKVHKMEVRSAVVCVWGDGSADKKTGGRAADI